MHIGHEPGKVHAERTRRFAQGVGKPERGVLGRGRGLECMDLALIIKHETVGKCASNVSAALHARFSRKPYFFQFFRASSRCSPGGTATSGKACFRVASMPILEETRRDMSSCGTSAGACEGSKETAAIPGISTISFSGWTRKERAQLTALISRMSMSSSTTTVILPNWGAKLQAPHMTVRGCTGWLFLIEITR